MSSRSSSSCVGTVILVLVGLILIRFGLPGLWKIVAGLFSTAFYGGLILVALILFSIAFFTYKNLQKNKKTQTAGQVSRVARVQELYKSLSERLQKDSLSNEISAEEYLESEMLIGQTLNDVKVELIRLKDFVAPRNERELSRQLMDYKRELQEASDPDVKQVIRENLKLLEEKKERMTQAHEEIRQKEASVDLIYHSLMRVEEDLKLGRPVRQLLPSEVYRRFGVTAPRDRERLGPLTEKSSGTE